VSLVLEAASFTVAAREFLRSKGSQSVARAVVESRAATVITVLFEDTAALVGLVIALAGVGLTAATGNPLFDALASLAIGVVLGAVAAFLAHMTKRLLIGQSATVGVEAQIRAAIGTVDGVEQILELKTLHMGPDFILLNLGIHFRPSFTTDTLEVVIDEIERRVKTAVPEVRRIFIEAEALKQTVAAKS